MLFLPSPMRQLNFFLKSPDVEKAVAELARLSAVHLSLPETGEGAQVADRWNRLLETYQDLGQRLDVLLDALGLRWSFEPPSRVPNPSEDAARLGGMLEEAEQVVDSWRKVQKEVAAERRRLRRLIRQIRLLIPVGIPLEEIRHHTRLHWVVGTMPEENYKTLRYALVHARRHRPLPLRRAPAVKLNIFVHKVDIEEVTLSLFRLGGFQFGRERGETWSDRSPRWKELADIYGDQVRRVEELLSIMGIGPSPATVSGLPVPSRDFEKMAHRLSRVESAVSDLRRRRQQAEAEKSRLQPLLAEMRSVEALKVPVAEMEKAAYLHWLVGKIPGENLEHLKAVLFRIPAVVIPIPVNGDRGLIVAATTREYGEILDTAMSGLFVEQVPFPGVQTTPAEYILQLQEKLTEIEAVLADLEKERQSLAQLWSQEAQLLWQAATVNLEAARAIAGFARHGDIFLISGRVPEQGVDSVAAVLGEGIRGRVEIEILEPSRGLRDVPVEMMLFRIPLVIIPVATEGDRQLIVAATTPRHEGVLDRVLTAVFMEPMPLPPGIGGVPSQVLPELVKRLESVETRLAGLRKGGYRLADRWSQRLRALRSEVAGNIGIVRAISLLPRQEETFLLSGWVPDSETGRVIAALEKATEGRAEVELVVPAAGGRRRPPTRMRNPAVFRPFEAMVRTFGVPGYDEIDPTPLAALSFTLMYGMMFGDVGHGLMLALAGLLGHLYGRGMVGSLGGVLIASGCSSSVFGVLFGTFFGREDLFEGLWINPMRDIFALFTVSLIGGAVLLSIGYLAFIANSVRVRNWGELLFGRGGLAAVVFYWGLIGGGYGVYRGMSPGMLLPAVLLAAGTVLFLKDPLSRLVMGERPLVRGDLRTMAVGGLFEVYETVLSHVSNTLSFVRLGAFAMTHAAFMQAVYSLAEIAGGGIGSWLILAAGTLLVVGFEGLVVGIQALRLEYYEFFTKFYGGRGIAYRPFRLHG